jgi:hypothetical protein
MYVKHEATFAGYPIVDWERDSTIFSKGANIAVAVRTDWDENENGNGWLGKFNDLLNSPSVEQIPALVIGMWHYEETVKYIVDALVANKAKFPNLKALFVGDITQEENEISWIKQDNLSPLWSAFPNLEYLTIRGGDGLQLGDLNLPRLKSLRIEAGGLTGEVVRTVGEAALPELESLVLWLGTSGYGGSVTIADLQSFYECSGKPKLRYLGLCDSEIANQVAEFIATAPVLQRLETLDLSLGVLTDEGALALLTSPYIRSLKKLDLHYHFCSEGMIKKLQELAKKGIAVDVPDKQRDRDWRFVAVGE